MTTDAEVKDESVADESYDFDEAYQSKIIAFLMMDINFCERTVGLIKPEYFTNVGDAKLASIVLDHYQKYKSIMDIATLKVVLKEYKDTKKIRADLMDHVKQSVVKAVKSKIDDREFAIEKVAEFAKFKAMEKFILDSAMQLDKPGKVDYQKMFSSFDKIKMIDDLGSADEYDFFEEIDNRTDERLKIESGLIKSDAITTGIDRIDKFLYHSGWGRGELSILMGAAKSGKSIGLANFARNAVMAGANTLFITLENSKKITAERVDSGFSRVEMNSLKSNIKTVQEKIKRISKTAGKFIIHEFPSGTMKPSMIKRLINRHKTKGTVFDFIVVDYLDIMAPEYRVNDNPIANSKSVYIDVRAIAQEEHVAILSATQTNRDGAKKGTSVASMEHVAEDFNKIRIADITISINATDEERERGEARLYFAASRNQESVTLHIKQDLSKMSFLEDFVRAT